MENYFAAKCELFNGNRATSKATAIINLDDPYGQRLINVFTGRKITYGFSENADVQTVDFKLSLQGISAKIKTPSALLQLNSNLVGKPHIYNIMAAVATAISLGIDLSTIKQAIESLVSVNGRFDRVKCDKDFAVIVDYAHTDDALRKVLETARQVATGRVVCLFGCGGDKDRAKRPLMGKAAAEGSDLVIITSDNPRSEDPEQIILQAEVGVKEVGTPYFKIIDRREAINFAIGQAKSGDLVVLAGKGHENYQILKDKTIHFDDKEVALEFLR
jgi:UDP-N-acetylmuramyl-tripeptide synthetase